MNHSYFKIKELDKAIITSFSLTEVIGAKLPQGVLSVVQSVADTNLNQDILTISVVLNKSIELSMIGYIESSNSLNGATTYNLTFYPKEFFTEEIIRKYDSIKSAIDSIISLPITGAFDVDKSLNGLPVYQNSISSYRFLTNYLRGINKDHVYTYRFDSLHFTNVLAPPEVIIHLKLRDKELPINVSRYKFKELEISDSVMNVNGLANIKYNGNVMTVRSMYKNLIVNFNFNDKYYLDLESAVPYWSSDILSARAGDIVTAKSKKYESTKYLVVSNHYELTTKECKQFLNLRAL